MYQNYIQMKNPVKILFIFSFFLIQVQAQEDTKIAFGPYIQQMTTKDATICWSTLDGELTINDPEGKNGYDPKIQTAQNTFGKFEAKHKV